MRVIISPIIAECEFWAVSETRRGGPTLVSVRRRSTCYAQGFGRGTSFPFSLGIDPITARTSLKPKAISNRQDAALVPRATLQTGGGGRTRP